MSYIGAEPTTAAFPFDQFSGNGSTTAFTLTYAPASTTSIVVSISGVVQNPNTYSLTGTTLNFSPAPPTGTNNIAVLYLGLPVIGVPSPGNTAYFSSTSFTATGGQTTFTPSGTYQVGFINVIRNGSQLAPADYTATNGTTVVLANACTAGDIVVIEVFNLVSIANAIPQSGGTFTGGITAPTVATSTGQLYPLILDTAKSATGTSVDFTGIPSTAKRITVMFSGVSTSGTSLIQIQIGSGSVDATSYVSNCWTVNTNNSSSTTGFAIVGATAAAAAFNGHSTVTLLSGFTYVQSGVLGGEGSYSSISGGRKTLSGTLTQVRITTVNGTDTFDAGTINIMWE